MEEYTVEYLDIFKRDLKGIADFMAINLDNKNAAHMFLKEVDEKIELLKSNPEMYQQYDFIKKLKNKFRYFMINNYIVFYEVNKEKRIITLHRVVYKKMNIKSKKGLFSY